VGASSHAAGSAQKDLLSDRLGRRFNVYRRFNRYLTAYSAKVSASNNQTLRSLK
jgi:hypothetical protein